MPQVVLVSSMGVTKPDHPLNRIGNGKVRIRTEAMPAASRGRMPLRTTTAAPTSFFSIPAAL